MSIGPLTAYTMYDSNTKTFTFTPTATADVGTQTIVVTLSDPQAVNPVTITINVLNHPPVYDSPVPVSPIYPSITIPLNSIKSIVVPPFHDPDGSDCTVYVNWVSKTIAIVDLGNFVANP